MRLMARLFAIPAVLLSLLPMGQSASAASLSGQTVLAQYFMPDLSTLAAQKSLVVGSGSELSCPTFLEAYCSVLADTWSLDIGVDTISFSQTLNGSGGFYSSASFNGWVFSGLNFGSGITGFSITSHGFGTLDASRVSFSANSVSVDLQGLNIGQDSGWTLTLSDAPVLPEPEPSPVPVPAAGWLLVAGLAGLGLIRRTRA